MNEKQIISQFFQNEDDAGSYIRNRLLGNFDKAPPPVSDRFIEEFPTDILQHLVLSGNLEDKTVFWNTCFRLFEEWRVPENADQDSVTGLGELVYMIRQFDQEEVFNEEKKRWQQVLANSDFLRATTYPEQEKNKVYAWNLSLVHIWNLWPDAKWSGLYEHMLKATTTNNDAQFDLMLITTQNLDWETTKTRQLFQWTLSQGHIPRTFYNKYLFNRLYLCGPQENNTDIERRKDCQTKLAKEILIACQCLSEILPRGQKETLGKALLEACELFDLKSFKCLNEEKRALLERELNKLADPPSEKQVNIYKVTPKTSAKNKYMSNVYAGSEQLAAA